VDAYAELGERQRGQGGEQTCDKVEERLHVRLPPDMAPFSGERRRDATEI
jgi:hypothetical protein